MKKIITIFTVFAFFLLLENVALATVTLNKGDKLRIKTSQTYLKSVPKPFGSKIIKTLKNGDTVTYSNQKGSWYEVEYHGKKGFIPKNSLIDAQEFKSFSKTSEVTQTDMAAATKGFSPEVEKKNRKNKALRYDLMEQAEKDSSLKEPLKNLQAFRKKGKLGEFQNNGAVK